MGCLRGFALIVLIIVPLLLCSAWPDRRESGELLYQSLRATGAIVQEANVQGWIKLKPAVWTVEGLEKIVQQSVAVLGEPRQNYRVEAVSTDEKDSVRLVSASSQKHYTIAATARRNGNAFMTVVINGPAEYVADYQRQADKILQANGGRPQISSCLVGWINGKLNNGEWVSVLLSSFTVLKAKVTDEMRDARIVSATGYSPRLPGGLTIDRGRVNINMASRYSTFDNRTYITLGTPLIAQEY